MSATSHVPAQWEDDKDGKSVYLGSMPDGGYMDVVQRLGCTFTAYGSGFEKGERVDLKAKTLADAKVEAVALVRERLTAILAALPPDPPCPMCNDMGRVVDIDSGRSNFCDCDEGLSLSEETDS